MTKKRPFYNGFKEFVIIKVFKFRAAKALKAAGVSKLPNLAALQSEYEKLQEQKEALYADYGRLKKQVKEYDVIKQNIDSILRQPREPEREKGKERE